MEASNKGQVIVRSQALKKIMLYAKRYANSMIPRNKWKEVYGVLIGRIEGMNVFVHDAEAMTAGDVTEVRFSDKEYENLSMLDEKISAKNDGTFICGWWHTHPFPEEPHSLFLSDIDIRNHLGYQARNPLAIALVHDPSKLSSATTPLGMKIFRLRSAEINEDDFDKMLVDPEFYKEGDNAYYYSVPFVISNVTPAFFAQSLVDLYDKVLAGEPPALAYDEEWHKVEMRVEREPTPAPEPEKKNHESESEAWEQEHARDSGTIEDTIIDETEREHIERPDTFVPAIKRAGIIGWVLPVITAALQFALAASWIYIGYNIIGGIFTLIIGIGYAMRVVAPACGQGDWKLAARDALDFGGFKAPKLLIFGIILEVMGLGIAGLPLLVLWYLAVQKNS